MVEAKVNCYSDNGRYKSEIISHLEGIHEVGNDLR